MRRRRVGARERRAVIARAHGRCEYCRCPAAFATQSFSVEHVIPFSRGGRTVWQNLALACPGCNGHKYDKSAAPDPLGSTLAALYHPRKQSWQDHFRWSDGFTRVVGLTATGRATVDALRLNRPGVVNMRRALLAIGEHPPASGGE